GRADQVGEPFDARIAIAEAEFRRRNPEFGIVGADAHVATDREAEPAADAIAFDHRDRGLWKFVDALVRTPDIGIVNFGGFKRGALALEFRNISARHERFP